MINRLLISTFKISPEANHFSTFHHYTAVWIYFILFFHLFLAVLGLCCCAVFSLVATSRGASRCRAQAPGCAGFSSCASWTLEHRLSSCGTRAWLLCGLWDRPTSEIKLVSPSLASAVFTTEPPGKSYHSRL